MTTPTLEELLDVWTERASTDVGERTRFGLAVLDQLADGVPADAHHLASTTGLPIAEVRSMIEVAAEAGYEVEHGAIVGAALTLRATRHHFRVRGHDLFTWCGFDALFVPILLAERAEVRSTCPVTDDEIRLTVQPDGSVHDVAPSDTVVAIVGREVTTCCGVTGPDSDVCTQMPLLASPAAGLDWLDGRRGVAVVDLDTARQVAAGYALWRRDGAPG